MEAKMLSISSSIWCDDVVRVKISFHLTIGNNSGGSALPSGHLEREPVDICRLSRRVMGCAAAL